MNPTSAIMQVSGESFLVMLRPLSGERAKITDIIKVLALMSPSQISRIGEVIVNCPTRRELFLIKALVTQYPTLNIRFERNISSTATATVNVNANAPSLDIDSRFSVIAINPIEQLCSAAEIIMRRGVGVEGIFRLTHSLDRPEELRAFISLGRPVNMDGDHPLDIASMLKLYTRIGFPNLLTESDLTDITKTKDCSHYLGSLSPDRRQYLNLLGTICRKVDAHKDITRMDLGNLARVFGPNFFQHTDPLIELRLINLTIEATKLILSVA